MLAEFNLFDVLGIARSELQHSKVLGWLLNPRGSHGVGDSLLREFLIRIVSEGNRIGVSHVSPGDVEGWNFIDVEVVRERHNIDILVIGKHEEFICFIENKVDSGEHSEQLTRYYATVKETYRGSKVLPVYLTPSGAPPSCKQDANRYVPIDYGRVADMVADTLRRRADTINPNVASFLEQYEQTLRRKILDTPSDLDRLALQIYSDHRDAVHQIIRSKPLLDITRWGIDPVVDRYGPEDLLHDHHDGRYRRFYSKTLDGIPELMGGEWTDSGRVALFEFMYEEEEHLTLTFMVGPGDQEIRERLWELGIRKEFENAWNLERNLKDGRHFPIYVKTILNVQDYTPFDTEGAVRKVEMAVVDFFEQDYWNIVNAVLEEFRHSEMGSE